MPRCKEISARAVDYMEGRLSWKERAAYGLHLATCRDCRTDFAQMRSTVALLGRLPLPPAATSVNEPLLQSFRAAWPPAPKAKRLPVGTSVGWLVNGAFGLLALILGGLQIQTWGAFPGWHLSCPLIELIAGIGPAVAVLSLASKGRLSAGRLAAIAAAGSFIAMVVLNRTCPLSHEASHILPLHVGAVLLAMLAGASLPGLSGLKSS